MFKQIAVGGLTPDSVFCLKPEMGAGPPREGWGGGGGYDRMYFNCLQIRRWAYNGGRVAFKWGEGGL